MVDQNPFSALWVAQVFYATLRRLKTKKRFLVSKHIYMRDMFAKQNLVFTNDKFIKMGTARLNSLKALSQDHIKDGYWAPWKDAQMTLISMPGLSQYSKLPSPACSDTGQKRRICDMEIHEYCYSILLRPQTRHVFHSRKAFFIPSDFCMIKNSLSCGK